MSPPKIGDNRFGGGPVLTMDPLCQVCQIQLSQHGLSSHNFVYPTLDVPSIMRSAGYHEGYLAGLAAAEAECRRLASEEPSWSARAFCLRDAADAIARLRAAP